MYTNLESFSKAVSGKTILVAYHHPCADGSLAAAILGLWIHRHGDAGVKPIFVGHYHSQAWEEEWAEAGVDMDRVELIVFLDVAPTYVDAQRLTRSHPLLIIDHHEGLAEDVKAMGEDPEMDVQVVYGGNDSGASLTWIVTQEDAYSEEWTEERFGCCPPLVRIVRARDLWRFGEDPFVGTAEEVKGLAEALYLTTPTNPEGMESRLLQREDALLTELRQNAAMAKTMLDLYCGKMAAEARKTSFRPGCGLDTSLQFYAVNCPPYLTSVMGEWLGSNGYDDCDFYLLWAKNEAKRAYGTSLRAPPASSLDLAALAKSMAAACGGSGGGHPRAAGHRLPPGVSWESLVV
jgi:oligoribonuclease NrnB/cAMP/cGMP phosphodiesterase (DHH superfamily)